MGRAKAPPAAPPFPISTCVGCKVAKPARGRILLQGEVTDASEIPGCGAWFSLRYERGGLVEQVTWRELAPWLLNESGGNVYGAQAAAKKKTRPLLDAEEEPRPAGARGRCINASRACCGTRTA